MKKCLAYLVLSAMLTDSARIDVLPTNHSVWEGSRFELNCSVEGEPPPYVAWINVTDGSVLQNRTVNTSYVIPSVSSLHKGTYRCVTGNKCGNDSKDTDILVENSKFNQLENASCISSLDAKSMYINSLKRTASF